jgi:hypothetical protein
MNTLNNISVLTHSPWGSPSIANANPVFTKPSSCDDLQTTDAESALVPAQADAIDMKCTRDLDAALITGNPRSTVDASSFIPTQTTAIDMKSSNVTEKPFEELLYQVMSVLIQEEEKATTILRDAIYAERQWQKSLSAQLEKEHSVCYGYEKGDNIVNKVADIMVPLSLVAAGVASMFATGGFSLVAAGAIAVGSILFLDTVLDNKAKQAVASALAKGNGEDTQTWFQRICMITSLTVFGMGVFVPGSIAVTLATNASQVALNVTKAGTGYLLNHQKARLIESEKDWEDSGHNMREMLGEVDRQVKSVQDMFELLSELQRSTAQTAARIC